MQLEHVDHDYSNFNDDQMRSYIQEIVVEYMSKSENRSLRFMEKKTGVSHSFIHRIVNGDFTITSRNILNIHAVLNTVMGSTQCEQLFSANPTLCENYEAVTIFSKSNLKEKVDINDYEKLGLESDEWWALMQTSNWNGVKKDSIYNQYGIKAESIINKLIGLSLVSESKDRLFFNFADKKKTINFSREMTKLHAHKLVEYYKPEFSGTNSNYMSTNFASVSAELRLRLFNKIDELNKWFRSEASKEENFGDHPIYTLTVMDSFEYGKLTNSLNSQVIQ